MNNIYRVWCANKNEWEKNKTALLPNGTLIDLDHYNKPVRSDTHKVYHCIGKEDKNKKLIYEGDKMKNTYVYVVAYTSNFQMISKEGYDSLEKARNRLKKQGFKPYGNLPMKYYKRGCGFAKIYEIKIV